MILLRLCCYAAGGRESKSCVAVAALCCLTQRYAQLLGRWIGPIGRNVAIRLFGLVLAAIAVELIVNGLEQMLPVLEG